MKLFGILLCALSLSAIAEDAPCTCPDMLDLASRNNQVKAAIQAYEQQLSAWTAAGGAPGANEAARIRLAGRHHRAADGGRKRPSSEYRLCEDFPGLHHNL